MTSFKCDALLSLFIWSFCDPTLCFHGDLALNKEKIYNFLKESNDLSSIMKFKIVLTVAGQSQY